MKSIVLDDLVQLQKRFEFKEALKSKSVLVTGATGLIGSQIIRFLDLLNSTEMLDIHVFGVARNREKAFALPITGEVTWIFQDLQSQLCVEEKIDYIIHAASPTQSVYLAQNPVEVITDTVIGAKNVFECAKEQQAIVVYLSSVEIYGQIFNKESISEEDYGYINHLQSRSCYPEAKKLIECMAASYSIEYGTDIRIARLTQTFGAGVSKTDNRVFAYFAKSIISGRDIVLHTHGNSSKSYIYTTDAINALFYILFKGEKGEAYNVANRDTYMSIRDFAQTMINQFCPDIKLIVDVNEGMGYAPDTQVNLSTEKLEALGWKPIYGFNAMITKLVNYLREE